jgi:hypothetical protein
MKIAVVTIKATATLASSLEEVIKNPDVTLHFSDKAVAVARYLHARRFRCAMVYCLDKPKHTIGNFPYRNGFSSYEEIEEALKEGADSII